MKADRVSDIIELFVADFFELLPLGGELLIYLDDLLGHHLVGFFGAPHQNEVRPGGKPFVAVGIQSEAQHDRLAAFLLLANIRHNPTLKLCLRGVKKSAR